RRSPRRIPRSRSRRSGPRTSPSTFGRSRRPWRPGHRARDPPRGRGGPRTASPWPRELPGLIQEPPDALGEVGRETVLPVPEPGGEQQPFGLAGAPVEPPRLLLLEVVVVAAVHEDRRDRRDLGHDVLRRLRGPPLVGET